MIASNKRKNYDNIKKLFLIAAIFLIFVSVFEHLFLSVKAENICSTRRIEGRNWSFYSVTKPLFSSKNTSLWCSIFRSKWICYDGKNFADQNEKEAFEFYYSLHKKDREFADYGEFLKYFNPSGFQYYCSSEKEIHNNELKFFSPNKPCPSILRSIFPKALIECADWKNLSRTKPLGI